MNKIDLAEIRRKNLLRLMKRDNIIPARLAEKIDRDQPYISAILSEPGTKNHRGIGNKILRLICENMGLAFPGNGVKRPQYFGHLTNDIIYRRLAPGVWKELKDKAEKDEKGRMKYRLHQGLTVDIGHPKLRDLLSSVTTIMKLSERWNDFKDKLDRIHPAYNETMLLPMELKDDTGKGI